MSQACEEHSQHGAEGIARSYYKSARAVTIRAYMTYALRRWRG